MGTIASSVHPIHTGSDMLRPYLCTITPQKPSVIDKALACMVCHLIDYDESRLLSSTLWYNLETSLSLSVSSTEGSYKITLAVIIHPALDPFCIILTIGSLIYRWILVLEVEL